jgi:two-component system, LytTR family, sensor histidine kinase AgrC
MISENNIYALIFLVIEAFIFLLSYMTLTSIRGFFKANKLKCILFVIFYAFFAYWASTYLPIGLHTACIAIFTILILSFITRTSVYNSTVVILIIGLVIALTDTLISSLYIAVFKVDLNILMNYNTVYYLVFTSTSKLIQIIIFILLYKSNLKWLKIHIFKDNSTQYLFIVIQLFLMALFMYSVNYNIGANISIKSYNFFLASLFILSIILAFFDIKERETLLKLSHKRRSLEEYVKNLEDVINVIRREKHDFMNHINTVFAICRLSKPNSLELIGNYLGKLINNLHSSYKFYETGNIYVDGLLAMKSNVCFENDLVLMVDIGADFKYADADECDIAGIVGNIINNAIESLLKSLNTDKKIFFETLIENNLFYIRIRNNGPEIPGNHLNRIFENGFTTKTDNSDHGFGLFITKQLVTKNQGKIFVTSDKNESVFSIVFKVRGDYYGMGSQRSIS